MDAVTRMRLCRSGGRIHLRLVVHAPAGGASAGPTRPGRARAGPAAGRWAGQSERPLTRAASRCMRTDRSHESSLPGQGWLGADGEGRPAFLMWGQCRMVIAVSARWEMTALRHSSPEEPGITRRRRGRAFSYHYADGRQVRDSHVLTRIRASAIPPAWRQEQDRIKFDRVTEMAERYGPAGLSTTPSAWPRSGPNMSPAPATLRGAASRPRAVSSRTSRFTTAR